MNNRINPAGVAGVRPKPDQGGSLQPGRKDDSQGLAFNELLRKAESKEVQFSKHATQRMESRQIKLSDKDLDLLSDGIRRADEKGSKESLLLMDKTAFVVNVKERTVITAVDEQGMKEKTFTNIDSAILINRG